MNTDPISVPWSDLRRRIQELVQSGQSAAVEMLLEEHPGLRAHQQLLIDCVYAEFCILEERGESPQPVDYLTRFPDCVDQLRALFEVHEALDARDSVGSSGASPQHSSIRNLALDPTKLGESPATASTGHQAPSRRIGPYKLLQLIGEGGMGAVYMADQLEPVKRRVALKVIKSGMDSRQVVARFEAERQALAIMDHQNIAKVLDAGISDDGTPYFAMELVQGMPITKYCDKEKLSIPDRLKLFVQVCRALQHAHQKGVIHRDIKPTNVLVTQRDGVPVAKVIDFGLAKALQSEHRLTDKTLFTEVGQVCGTLEYMSPEQAEMNELGLDTRTDVYSLGVLLYELLTGSTPLGHDRIRKEAFHRVLELILKEEPPRPSRRLSDSGEAISGISEQRRIEPRRLSGILKRELDWIALKALDKDRNRRYDGAGTLADDVQHYLDGEVVTARPPSTGYRLRKAVRKHKAAFVSGTVFVLLLLAGLIGTGTMWLQSQREAIRASKAESDAIEQAENARTAEAQARAAKTIVQQNLIFAERTAYASDMLLAQRHWEDSSIGPIRERLERYRNRDYLKGFEWGYWNRLINSDLRTFTGHTNVVQCVRFSPDGKRIVSGGGDKTVRLWDAETGQETLVLRGHTDSVESVCFSPNGKRVASGGGDQLVRLWDAETGQETLALKGHASWISGVMFSPDGDQIVSGSADRTVKVWDVKTGRGTVVFTGHTGNVYSVGFSPDGGRIVSGGGVGGKPGEIYVWDVATGETKLIIKGHTDKVYSVSFGIDGKRIVSGSSDGSVKVWDTETGKEILTLTGHSGPVMCVRFSADGKRIVSGGGDSTVRQWDVESGQETQTLRGHTADVTSVSFSPDGKEIVSSGRDRTVKLWDAECGQDILTLDGHTSHIRSVNFSPDGNQIVSSDQDNSVKVWDAMTGQLTLALIGHSGGVAGVSFSPDGKYIVSGSWDKTLKVWDAKSGRATLTITGHAVGVSSVDFSPDGKRIVSGGDSQRGDGEIKVWNASTGQEAMKLNGRSGDVRSVCFSPDGKWIASGSRDKTVKVWNADSGQETLTLKGHADLVNSVCFSPDGKRIVSGSGDRTVKLWDAKSGRELHTLIGHAGGGWSVRFSPDGNRIASGSADRTVKLWEATTGQETLALNGHTHTVNSVSFSPDGKRIVSGSSDMTVKLWDDQPWTAEQRDVRKLAEVVSLAAAVVRRAWQQEFETGDVVLRIRADQTITESVREKALQLVEIMGPTANELNAVSWNTVRKSDLKRTDYEKALRQIKVAIESEHNNGFYLNTLGVALYRVGDYQSALTTLKRSEPLNSKVFGGSLPQDLVFMAMANQQLGNTGQAKEQLQQVRQLSQEPRWSDDKELQGFLKEAEALIESVPSGEKEASADPAPQPTTEVERKQEDPRDASPSPE